MKKKTETENVFENKLKFEVELGERERESEGCRGSQCEEKERARNIGRDIGREKKKKEKL